MGWYYIGISNFNCFNFGLVYKKIIIFVVFILLQVFVDSVGKRWSSYGDMVVQYVYCVVDILKNYNMLVELYFDIWKLMNKRF